MPAQPMRPASKQNVPDPSDSYERAHPEHESGIGRLDNDDKTAVPTPSNDSIGDVVSNRQDGTCQLNGQETQNQRKSIDPAK